MYICTTCVLGPLEARVGVGSSGNGVIDGCELPYGSWELNLGPPKKESRPSLVPGHMVFKMSET